MRRACRRLLPFAALVLAACADRPPAPAGPLLEAASLPTFRVGDRVSWSNGQTETVVAAEGEVVRWRDQDGNTFAGYRNFLLPSLEWDTRTTRAQTAMDVPPDLLWPLKAGANAHFAVNQRLTLKIHQSEVAYRDEWMCGVDGTERVGVLLGTFDTWRLRCARYWQGSNLGEIVWNYAPALGQVVRRTWTGAEAPEELVAYGHGAVDARTERMAAKVRQQGLEALASGRKAVGRSGDLEITVQPRATWRASGGAWCRDFVQTLHAQAGHATTAGSACRDEHGVWQVVGRPKG